MDYWGGGGQSVSCPPPPLKLLGGGAWPPWPPLFLRLFITLHCIADRMDQNCGTVFPNHNGYGQISFKFSPYNTSHYDCAVDVYSIHDLMVVFVDVNLPNALCGEGNISVTKYYYMYERRDVGFSGIIAWLVAISSRLPERGRKKIDESGKKTATNRPYPHVLQLQNALALRV